jgi:hypothetical protein
MDQSEPNITLSRPTVCTTSATEPSQNGLTPSTVRNEPGARAV